MPMAWAGLASTTYPPLTAAVVSALAVAIYVWQDGINPCNDGDRYTSGKDQPYPFHRRWCGWNTRVLQVASVVCLVALGAMMGGPKHAALFCSLPGFWFVSVHLTCVDAVAMCLAMAAALLYPVQPYFAVLLACASGYVHERGPVFAALYAGAPFLLVGLAAVGWWRKPAKPDKDKLVGHGTIAAIKAHKPYTDWLDWRLNLLSLRGVTFFAAHYGADPKAWLTLLVAWASRIMGTDGARYIWWGSPFLIRELPAHLPWWMVAVHVLTFRRMI